MLQLSAGWTGTMLRHGSACISDVWKLSCNKVNTAEVGTAKPECRYSFLRLQFYTDLHFPQGNGGGGGAFRQPFWEKHENLY